MIEILEPFRYEFFIKGILASIMVGALCGVLGVYVVLKKMSYIGHGLAHSIFGGAVLSYVLSFNFYIGATIWGFLSAFMTYFLSKKRTIASDAAIGIITTASFAMGIGIISKFKQFTRSFDAALFGNVLGITNGDLITILIVLIFIIFVITIGYKYFLFVAFDSTVANVYGIKIDWVEIILFCIIATGIVVSVRVLGVTLIVASLIIPPTIARIFIFTPGKLFVISAVIGIICGITGMYISYYIDISSGPSIVLVLCSGLGVALFTDWARKFINEKNFLSNKN